LADVIRPLSSKQPASGEKEDQDGLWGGELRERRGGGYRTALDRQHLLAEQEVEGKLIRDLVAVVLVHGLLRVVQNIQPLLQEAVCRWPAVQQTWHTVSCNDWPSGI